MTKKLFVSGFTGDIWNAVFQKLLTQKYDVTWINSRLSEFEIQKIFDENIDLDKSNILINAVGWGNYWMFHELWDNDYQKSFEGNFLVPSKIFKCFVKRIRFLWNFYQKKIDATIININSKSSLEAFGQWSAYSTMKSAITMLLKIIEKENKKYWLHTKEVFPGVIKTKLLDKMPYIPQSWVQDLAEFVQDFLKEII